MNGDNEDTERPHRGLSRSRLVIFSVLGLIGAFVLCLIIRQSQSSSQETAPNVAPAPAFANEQNDPEGYGGVPWGISFDDFQKAKPSQPCDNADCEAERDSNYAEEREVRNRFSPYAGHDADEYDQLIAEILGIPNDSKGFIPAALQSAWRKSGRDNDGGAADYFFFNGRLAMVIADVDDMAYDAVLAKLNTSDTLEDTLHGSLPPPLLYDRAEFEAHLFKRGGTNTRIYLVKKTIHDAKEDMYISSAFLLYIPNQLYGVIGSETKANADQWQRETDAGKQGVQQRNLNQVQ